jgi:Ca-activated chloride channel family protein
MKTAWVGVCLAFTMGCASAAGPGVARPGGPETAKAAAVAGDPAASDKPAPGEDGPRAGGPWLGAAGASDAVLPGARDSFLGVWVDVPSAGKRAHTPLSVALVIDTSGSMAGIKIEHARLAARALVQSMHDGDIVAVDTFSDEARERVAPTVLSASSRPRVLASLAGLEATGGTNLFEGVRLGEQTVLAAPATHPVRRVVVVSDGIATVGATSPEILGALAARGAERGVQVSSIGVGLDYSETALNELAIRSSGRLYHLAEPRELANIVDQEVKLLDSTMATNAFVEVLPAPGVQLLGIDGIARVERRGEALRVPMGTMFAGQHREMLVRVRVHVEDQAEGSRPLASVRLHFDDPADGGIGRVQEVVARHQVTRDPALVARASNDKVQAIASVQQAAQAAVRAAQQVNADDFDGADRELAAAEQQILASASKSKDKVEQKRLQDAAGKMGSARRAARTAAAAPPAAKPAAKRAGALDANSAGMSAAGF